jgi:hypothetical protein
VLTQAQRERYFSEDIWSASSTTLHTGDIVSAQQAQLAHLDPRPCPVPPNWQGDGYGSIFSAQKSF